jgi:hypothetical protein
MMLTIAGNVSERFTAADFPIENLLTRHADDRGALAPMP